MVDAVYGAILAVMGFVGMYFSLATTIELDFSLRIIFTAVIMGAGFAIFLYGAVQLPLIVLGAFAALGLLFRKVVKIGAYMIWQEISGNYLRVSGWDMTLLRPEEIRHHEVSMVQAEAWEGQILFLFVLLIILILVFMILHMRALRMLPIVLTAIPLSLPLSAGIIPPYLWTSILIVFWGMLLFDLVGKPVAIRIAAPVLMAGILALMLWQIPTTNTMRTRIGEDIRLGIEGGSRFGAIFRGGGIAGTANRVSLRESGNVSFTGGVLLQVKMDLVAKEPETIAYEDRANEENAAKARAQAALERAEEKLPVHWEYLRGFIGSVYEDGVWKKLSYEDEEALKEVIGEIPVQNYPQYFIDSMLQYYGGLSRPESSILVLSLDGTQAELSGDYERMEIRNLWGNTHIGYMPYGLMETPESLAGLFRYQADAGFTSANRIFGTDAYAVNAYPYLDQYWEALAATAGAWEQNREWRRNHIGSEDTVSQTEEEIYRKFAYGHYLDVPEEIAEGIHQYLDDRALTPLDFMKYELTHAITIDGKEQEDPALLEDMERRFRENPEQFQIEGNDAPADFDDYLLQLFHSGQNDRTLRYTAWVLSALNYESTYTLQPGLTPREEDFILYFLTRSHQGYCRHYAAAATMLLRAAGIPARYVEGYYVSSGWEADENGWINITDDKSHAWTEIYLDGFGWYPVETVESIGTSLVRSVRGRKSSSSGSGSEFEEDDFYGMVPDWSEYQLHNGFNPEDYINLDDLNGAGEAGEGKARFDLKAWFGGLSTMQKFFAIGVSIFVLVMLVAVSFSVNRQIQLGKRRKKMQTGSRSERAIEMYRYMLELIGYIRYGTISPETEKVGLKAKFSNHEITEDELAIVEKEMNEIRARAEFIEPKWYWKLYNVYIRGLV